MSCLPRRLLVVAALQTFIPLSQGFSYHAYNIYQRNRAVSPSLSLSSVACHILNRQSRMVPPFEVFEMKGHWRVWLAILLGSWRITALLHQYEDFGKKSPINTGVYYSSGMNVSAVNPHYILKWFYVSYHRGNFHYMPSKTRSLNYMPPKTRSLILIVVPSICWSDLPTGMSPTKVVLYLRIFQMIRAVDHSFCEKKLLESSDRFGPCFGWSWSAAGWSTQPSSCFWRWRLFRHSASAR